MLEQMGLTQGVLEFTKNFSSSLSGNNNEQSDGNVFVASMMSLFNGTILDSDTGGYNGDGGDGGNQPPIFDPRRQTQTLFKVQLYVCTTLGLGNDPDDENAEPVAYLVICTIFTYIFTGIIFWFLFKETNHIIKVRQRFLGSQRSLTDRTIFIKNIPKEMCNEEDLKSHIEELKVGKIDQIRFVYDYSPLIELYNVRDGLIRQLEIKYSQLCGLDIQMFDSVNVQNVHLKVVKSENPPSKDKIVYNPYMKESCINDDDNSDAEYYILNIDDEKYEKKKRSCVKVEKSDKEIIDESLRRLIKINDDINECRASNQFKRLPLAFVTMDSVTDAQMAAQAN
ncbi:Calcium permeable stress-gated cation channel 1 [Pichia kudriavzevii]|uniref:Calcium permeable stress-gated cation channel 1 n=1 Tax=Pichia kudriavzevii TaxID=4909 RepID=A0A1V2LWL9_PICKU|nr:Calcium permeable stress-gated cation channel 1 [Pichia kudriavzevii]